MPDIDVATATVTLLPNPKGKKHAMAAGFCGQDPLGNIQGAQQPVRWVGGKPVAFGYEDTRKISVAGGSAEQACGCWRSARDDERALVWTVDGDSLGGADLHPAKWDRSYAAGCGGGQQVGFGYQKFTKDPCRALLWSGTRDSMVILTGPEPAVETYGRHTDGETQAGYYDTNGRQHACLWRGDSASFTDLHPAGMRGSELYSSGGGQQVGYAWDDSYEQRAALWSGSSASFVDLAPKGFKRSCATACAHGFQAGWIQKEDMGPHLRAALWRGTRESLIDLHAMVPPPYTVSSVIAMTVGEGRLRVLGTAQQNVKQNGYDVNMGSVAILWEFPLRGIVEASKEKAVKASNRQPEVLSDERLVERLVSRFAQAIIAGDFAAAHAMLAPWTAKERTAPELETWLESHRYADAPRTGFVTEGNDITLKLLREFSPDIPADVTDDNFRQWLGISFTPDDDADAGVDYLHRLMVIVVQTEGGMRIGYLEQGE